MSTLVSADPQGGFWQQWLRLLEVLTTIVNHIHGWPDEHLEKVLQKIRSLIQQLLVSTAEFVELRGLLQLIRGTYGH